MSSVSSLPDEGDEIHGPGLPKPIRLSEVIQIAAERLDGVADGSLKEALALRPADPPITPEPEPTGRVEAGSSGSSADPPALLAETAEASPANPESARSPDVSQATAEPASGEGDAPQAAPDAAGDTAEAPSVGPPSLATETIEVERTPRQCPG